MKIGMVNYEEDFDAKNVVTNPEGIDKRKRFTPTGIYSEVIFGKMHGDGLHYSCDCNKTHEKFLVNSRCPECGGLITARESVISRCGWIDFGENRIINPTFVPFIEKVIGRTALEKILKFERKLDVNGNIEEEAEFTKAEHFYNLGLFHFCDNFEGIIRFFGERNRKRSSGMTCSYVRKIRSLLLSFQSRHTDYDLLFCVVTK